MGMFLHRYQRRQMPVVLWLPTAYLFFIFVSLTSLLAACARPVDRVEAPATLQNGTRSSVPHDDGANTIFAGRSQVTVAELMKALSAEAERIAKSSAVRKDYQRLLATHGLQDNARLYADYVRVHIAFEATRAGGLWGVTWTITDALPQSDHVWTQWHRLRIADVAPKTTAYAECDELSALFAFVAKGIGLSQSSQAGLLWPTSNHTVAVWMPAPDKRLRIVVPTSQIFLDAAQTLDTRSFDPWKQAKVYDYRRRDAAAEMTLSADVARYFVMQVRQHGGASQTELQTMRNRREAAQRNTAAGS